MSVNDYMRPIDVEVFREAARRFKVWIVLRASNPAGKQYIRARGFVPKRIDCKAKTADKDVTLPGGLGNKKTAGLVVNPEIPGMLAAFDDTAEIVEDWLKFKTNCFLPKPGAHLLWFPGGKQYSVQMNSGDEHYGCVLFSVSSNLAAASYIHSDYDLFGIVPQSDPSSNVRVVDEGGRHGQPHTRSQLFFDVQHYLNHRMGVPMILHGEQDTFKEEFDDNLDVFCPDGQSIIAAYGADAIRRLYAETFKGRPLYDRGSNPKPLFGQWQILRPSA
jgi:hypothetical protein